MMTMNSSEKKLTHKDLMGIFWRSFRQDAVWNFERQQNLGSAYTMSRVVGKFNITVWNLGGNGRRKCK